MDTACVEPRPLYRPRDPQASDLWRVLDEHFDSFQQVCDQRYQAKYGYWRPIIEPPQADVIEEILKHCGLWQSWSPRAPPKVDELVLEVDAACSSRSIDSPGPADESQELTCVDIDSFQESF